MSARGSRLTLLGLLARQSRSDAGPLLAVALIVLLLSTIAAAAPLALHSMTKAEVAYQLETMPSVRRDLIGQSVGSPALDPGTQPFGSFERIIARLAGDSPAPLRDALGTPNYLLTSNSIDTVRLGGVWNDPQSPVTINVAPHLADHVTITDGTMPNPFAALPFVNSNDVGDPSHKFGSHDSIDIVLSSASAQRAEWKVGEFRALTSPGGGQNLLLRLSGVFVPNDPADPFWAIASSAIHPGISHTPFSGTNTLVVTGGAFIDAASWPVFAENTGIRVTTFVGIPLSTAELSAQESEALLPQLRHFIGLAHPLASVARPDAAAAIIFDSDAGIALTSALQRAGTATAVLAMVASGPIGVALATLWLLSRLIVLRRRAALSLASARGASGIQLRSAQAIEVFAVSLPAAIFGAFVAYSLFPTVVFTKFWTPLPLIFSVLVALFPAMLIWQATSLRGLRSEREDIDPRERGKYRWVVEIIIAAITALAVFLLLQRGLTTNGGTVAIDPLLAATPLLLCLTGGLIALRLYPFPLFALSRWAKSRRGIVTFLGASRAIRDPAAGLAPVLAMVIGLAVATFSGALLGTVTHGVFEAAQSTVGAQLRIDSPPLAQDQLDALTTIPGVSEVAGVYQSNRPQNLSVEVNISVPILVGDTAAIARIQAGIPGAAQITKDMSTKVNGAIPIMLSPDLARQYNITSESTLAGIPIVSAGTSGTSTSLSGVPDWVLIDSHFSAELDIENFLPKIVLLSLDHNANAAEVASAALAVAGDGSSASTPADVVQLIGASPVSGGLQFALLLLIVLVALLCAGTVVLAMMIGRPVRDRTLALLRTLGMTPIQGRRIVGWELAPFAILAAIAGCALGLLLPFLVLASLDLRPFTGGTVQPPLVADPFATSLILGGFITVVLAATTLALAIARRVSLARTLRTSEEG